MGQNALEVAGLLQANHVGPAHQDDSFVLAQLQAILCLVRGCDNQQQNR